MLEHSIKQGVKSNAMGMNNGAMTQRISLGDERRQSDIASKYGTNSNNNGGSQKRLRDDQQ